MAEVSIMKRAISVRGEISYSDTLKFSKQLYSRTVNRVCGTKGHMTLDKQDPR